MEIIDVRSMWYGQIELTKEECEEYLGHKIKKHIWIRMLKENVYDDEGHYFDESYKEFCEENFGDVNDYHELNDEEQKLIDGEVDTMLKDVVSSLHSVILDDLKDI